MVEKLKKGQCKEDRTKRLLLRHRFETRRCRVGLTNGAFHQSNAVTTLWPRGGDSAHQAQSRSGRLGSTPIPRWRRWPISARPRLRRDRTDSNMAAGCTCCFFCPLGASKDVCVCVCVCVCVSWLLCRWPFWPRCLLFTFQLSLASRSERSDAIPVRRPKGSKRQQFLRCRDPDRPFLLFKVFQCAHAD